MDSREDSLITSAFEPSRDQDKGGVLLAAAVAIAIGAAPLALWKHAVDVGGPAATGDTPPAAAADCPAEESETAQKAEAAKGKRSGSNGRTLQIEPVVITGRIAPPSAEDPSGESEASGRASAERSVAASIATQ